MNDTFEFPLTSADTPVIVGIGASAGGLEALQKFLDYLPFDNSLAIVIVQHLDPDHDSLLGELLTKRTKTPVFEAVDGMQIKPSHIYLIAPGQSLTVMNGQLKSEDFHLPRGRRRPIDCFLTSLAEHSGERAVGIILSGTGSDGSLGARAIKAAGGLVFVQAVSEAKYDGMPRSAIETGVADIVLPVAEMFPVLNDYFDCRGGIQEDALTDREFIDRAMRHVRYRTGHDFAGYKPGTLLRRVAVRMSVLGQIEPGEYLKVLINDPEEVKRLFKDVLINVTSFFRDDAVFEELSNTIIPELLEGRTNADELRIWVPGCSSGQEAYSIAILISETMERLDVWPRVLIFGTDIDEDALEMARRGQYLNTVADEIPTEYLHKYFKWRSDGYTVNDRLRAMVRFSNQSIIKDPPFSQIDLVTCRNVLIYFDKVLQEKAIRVFHYGLREGGILVLGTSESPISAGDMFKDVSRTNRIYRRLPGPARRLDLVSGSAEHDEPQPPQSTPLAARDVAQANIHSDKVIDLIAPAYFVLGNARDLQFASDAAAGFLKIKGGRPQLDLLKLIRPELEKYLRRLLNRNLETGETSTYAFRGTLDDVPRNITITRQRLPNAQDLLLFQDQALPDQGQSPSSESVSDATARYITELEGDLDEARDQIRSTVEELETSNEELKSSNEEMMSMNEELQSANEELTTTNDELNNKITEVRDANTDLANFIRSTKIGTVFLDPDLRLRNYTPEATEVFRFQESDVGRRIDDIGSDLDMESLVADCQSVMESQSLLEKEYDTRRDRSYRARFVPYAQSGHSRGGVVVSLFEVTELRKLAEDTEQARKVAAHRLEEIEELYSASPQAMALLDTNLRYVRANTRLSEILGVPVDDMIGASLGEMSGGMAEKARSLAKEVLLTQQKIENYQMQGALPVSPGNERVFQTDWYPVFQDGELVGVGINVRDTTEMVQMQFELRRIMQELQHRVKNMLANVLALVSRARRDATADAQIFAALSQRIQALAQTHKLLTQSNWASAKLQDVLRPELVDVYGAERVQLKGPDITVNARAALSLGMAIHELATNAAKYGSFSVEDGQVSLSWVRQDDGESDDYIFNWQERFGPSAAESETAGFGSQLIKSTIEGSLDGQVEFYWEQTGLRCVFIIPKDSLIEIPHDSVFDTLTS
ncbi:chemotaxis protein CheB [Loktanella sp. SALINAS62]|uniref:chemotaxis protein CheB n=1 Tax=Loktanella sp. SALINAS62 TaxID=2706124 RepID=UPI001B8B14A1|nr:chemotaxis protein CheB [Loktanella sp. SALINAS62]MBS1302307.1 PAS domain-containing protein [Loktanella sp. SALINAS62]